MHSLKGASFITIPASSDQAFSLLADLCSIDAISGREQSISDYIENRLSNIATDIRTDALGNLICSFSPGTGSKRTKIMLAAHMDEIGLLVQWIEESGAVRVLPVGGVDIRTLLGKRVTVHGRKPLTGIIGTMPPHLSTASERDKIPTWDDLFIDLGLSAQDVKENVRPGDPVAFTNDVQRLLNDRMTAKALDNRAGLAATILAFEALAGTRASDSSDDQQAFDSEIVFVATSQEELGYRGAIAATRSVDPDVAIAIDVGFANTPGISERQSIVMGHGPSVAIGANLHPGVVKILRDIAEEHVIPHQIEVLPAQTGTDAWAIQTSGVGVPTGLLSIPLRNMHSAVEIVQLSDVQHTADLLERFSRQFDMDDLKGWHHD